MEVTEVTDINNVVDTSAPQVEEVEAQQTTTAGDKEDDDQVKDMEVDEIQPPPAAAANTDDQNKTNDEKNTKSSSPSVSLNPVHHFNAICDNVHHPPLHKSKLEPDWLVRAPQPIRMKQQRFSQDQSGGGDGQSSSFTAKKLFNTTKSAFNSQKKLQESPTDLPSYRKSLLFPSDEVLLLSRCNSAPLPAALDAQLQDSVQNSSSNGDSNRNLNPSPKPVPRARTNRSRCLSASVSCSKNLSPAPFAKNKFRLTQLIKEESIQGIQNKEKEHEREVQFSFQISNMSEVSLNDGNKTSTTTTPETTDHVQQQISSNSSAAVTVVSGNKPLLTTATAGNTTPTSAVLAQSSLRCRLSPLAGPKPHDQNLAFFSPPCNISPNNQTPLSPTRVNSGNVVGGNSGHHVGRQMYSPCMLVARGNSRSPSPSPTRKSFITRRRSQSPIVLRPSALGSTLKRKYDSDNEGCISPKRPTTNQLPITPTNSKIVASGSFQMNNQITPPSPVSTADIRHISPVAGSVTPPFRTRPHLQRPSSLASTMIFSRGNQQSPNTTQQQTTVMMSPLFPSTPRTHHHHTNTFTTNPHTLLSSSNSGNSERCSSPASSTCSSSSLEGLKDLQPTIHQPPHYIYNKKDCKSNLE